ncbi:MAG TPA: DUF2062 domain-containing protein [Cyanobacteria bacterium UBA8803]|nr:DUF2062 domain-containing protein [Cyanobacteria bacterium UBA9273]HBL57338.1 DUF2062 domain-containing protein [Cyanobacteria bacterium UBA8803]
MSRKFWQTSSQRLSSAAKPISLRYSSKRGTKQRFRRWLQYLYWRLVRLKGRPESLARGLACGVFGGLLPLFGLQIVISVLLAVLLRGNKIIAAAGTWISNPLTSVPIYAFNFRVGQWLLDQDTLTDMNFQSWENIKALGGEIILALVVGCLAVGLVGAISSYFLGLWLIRRARASYRLQRRGSH